MRAARPVSNSRRVRLKVSSTPASPRMIVTSTAAGRPMARSRPSTIQKPSQPPPWLARSTMRVLWAGNSSRARIAVMIRSVPATLAPLSFESWKRSWIRMAMPSRPRVTGTTTAPPPKAVRTTST